MLIRVMLCFLGKVEGVSRGIAVKSILSLFPNVWNSYFEEMGEYVIKICARCLLSFRYSND